MLLQLLDDSAGKRLKVFGLEECTLENEKVKPEQTICEAPRPQGRASR
jgi:hypothetical protein